MLVFGALVAGGVPFMLLGRPEFGALAAMPLSEFVMPGVPYPPVAPFICVVPFIWFAGLAVLPAEPLPPAPPAACA